MNAGALQLALGPILYFWPRQQVLDFYARIADTPVDIVYLGEVVCAKRRALRGADWLALARELGAAGKQVILSTLALVEAESELAGMRRIIDNGEFPVEANDMAAVNMLAAAGAAFTAGPYLNVYNAATLRVLAGAGARRWVAPVEHTRALLAAILAERPAGMAAELMVYGRLPLALSARCFTARAHNLPKDACDFRCGDYPDGMPLNTRDDRLFLTLNGIQTQSGAVVNLIGELADMAAVGINAVRLSPQAGHMEEVIASFRAALAGRVDSRQAGQALAPYLPAPACNGYWYGRSGMDWQTRP